MMFELGGDSWSLLRVLSRISLEMLGYKNILDREGERREKDCADALSTGRRISVIRDVALFWLGR